MDEMLDVSICAREFEDMSGRERAEGWTNGEVEKDERIE
jgi:hypothetical protein